MTLRLTVDRARWEQHIAATVDAFPDLIPVVKGNGYGFGRPLLHTLAASLSTFVCVGTVHELDHLAPGVRPVVLTPTRAVPEGLDDRTILTVGSLADVDALGEWGGAVIVKLRSSMRRFGATVAELRAVLDSLGPRQVVAFGLHLPLAGSDDDRLGEVRAWLEHLPGSTPLWVSHLDAPAWAAGRAETDRPLAQRIGSRLWHGSKQFLHLQADVLAVHRVGAGERVGYRATEVPGDGHLVVIGTGSAAGVTTNDGRSPFHFARTNLHLLEPVHMHAALAHVPAGAPCPQPGDWVDVQRPLINVSPDEIQWQ